MAKDNERDGILQAIGDYDAAEKEAKRLSKVLSEAGDDEEITVLDRDLKEKGIERMMERDAAELAAREARKVTIERLAPAVTDVLSERNNARLVVLTRDATVFRKDSGAWRQMLELASMFAEVHVIVLNSASEGKEESVRVGDSIWLYPTNSRFFLMSAFDARKIAKKQLQFGNGFRADIVIAMDPFESGLAGYLIGKRYDRPFQVHVRDDFFDPDFRARDERNVWRAFMARYVLQRTPCLRTPSAYLKDRIEEGYPNLQGKTAVFPTYYDLAGWQEARPETGLHERYPEFKFIVLHVSSMNERANTGALIDGCYYLLRQYPWIGLVIIGEGPLRALLEKQVADYNLSSQVRFAGGEIDTLSSMKGAEAFVYTSKEDGGEEPLLMAASVGIPLIAGNRGLASELFIDEESVLLCPVDDPACFGEKVNRLLNDNPLREKLVMNARDSVLDNVEQDYVRYIEAYRASIESCLVAPGMPVASEEVLSEGETSTAEQEEKTML